MVWTGHGEAPIPLRADSRVRETFGAETATQLLPQLRGLEGDFYESTAYNTVADFVEMGEHAAAEFRERHPDLPETGVAALRWCYMWDWK